MATPRLSALLVTALAFAVAGALWNPLSPACVAAVGALLTVAAARNDRFLLGAALIAFAVRAMLAVTLQWIAALDLNGLHALLETEPLIGYRTWIFALDSKWYHLNALHLLAGWKWGTEFPSGTSAEYVVVIAIVYRLFGPDPLNAVLWNALFGALAVVVGYRIAERVAGPTPARVTAVLIALWPSAILWSTQLLKDAICLWLILVLLYLTIRIVEPPLRAGSLSRAAARWTSLLALLFATAFALYRFRPYVLLLLMLAPTAFIVHGLVRRTRQTPWRIFAACVAMGVMFLGLSAGGRVNLERVFGPPYPHIARVKVGVMHHSRGELNEARWSYERALWLVAEYPPALKRLAMVAVALDDRSRAIAYFERYLTRRPDDEAARTALEAVRSRPEGASLQAIPLPDLALDSDPPTTPVPVTTRPGAAANRLSMYGDVVAAIRRARMGFVSTGGHSTMDADVEFHGYRDVLRYVPRAVANVFLIPYPSQWFDVRGTTGPFKALSAVEAILLYVLIVPLIIGVGMVLRRGSPEALYLALFVVSMAVLLGLVVSNAGTLFRLRLESLLPLFTAGGLGCTWLVRQRPWRA